MSERDILLLAYALATRDSPPSADGFQDLVRGRLRGITTVCLLLAARSFLESDVPRLLSQLGRSMNPQRVVLRHPGRGSVDWSATLKARHTAGQDATIFVCRESWRRYDLPENQLLRYLLTRLRSCEEGAPAELRGWFAAHPERPAFPEGVPVGDTLARLAHRLRRYEAHASLREVGMPLAIEGRHVRAARSLRNPLYGVLADLYELYAASLEVPRWRTWRRLVSGHAALLPASEARAFAALWP